MTVYKGSTAQSELSQGSNTFAEAYKGSQKIYGKSGGIPTFGTRLNNMCTVVGTITDSTGQELVYALLDRSYRKKGYWSTEKIDTGLINYTTDNYMNDPNSATENTNYILTNYDNEKYPAFSLAREAGTIVLKGNIYYSQLVNMKQLIEIKNNKAELDKLDPTSGTRLASENFCWVSQEQNSTSTFGIVMFAGMITGGVQKQWGSYTAMPVFEIPVSVF